MSPPQTREAMAEGDLQAMVDALTSFPSNGKPPANDTTMQLVIAGLIERKEVTKPCRTCGRESFDYSFMRITVAGKLFLAAAALAPTPPEPGQ